MSEKQPDTPVVHLPWSHYQAITARLDALEALVLDIAAYEEDRLYVSGRLKDKCILYDLMRKVEGRRSASSPKTTQDQQFVVTEVVNRALRAASQPAAPPPPAAAPIQGGPHPDAVSIGTAPPPAAPCALDRLLQAADQVLDDMQDGTSCCPAARDALRDALCPFRPRLAEIDGVPLPTAPCADEVEVVARVIRDHVCTAAPGTIAQAALAALSPLRQAERERAWREGAEGAAKVAERALEGGWLCPYGRDKPGDVTWHHTEADKCPACGKDAANSLFACHDTASGRIAAAIRALSPSPGATP